MQSNILEKNPSAKLRVYAVFFEMVSGDEGAKHKVSPHDLFDDPRVRVYWDERKVLGRWYDENVTRLGKRRGEDDRIEWDTFILYGADAKWGEPYNQLSWGRPLNQERERLASGLEIALER